MIINEYDYNEYKIEIHEHPIYHDFEFVVKQNNQVKFTSTTPYKTEDEAHLAAQASTKPK